MKETIKKSYKFVVKHLQKYITILKDSYLYCIWISFKETHAWFTFPFGIASWFIPDMSFEYRILIFFIFVATGIMVALFNAGMKVFYRTYEIPVVHIVESEGKSILLLLRCSNIFPIGTIIDVYVKEGEFEKYTGSGEVINIQNNLLTQVRILKTHGENSIYKNKKSNLIIKIHDESKGSKSSE